MADERNRSWNKFQKLRFDKKQTLSRLRRAENISIRHAHKFILTRWRNVRDVRRIVVLWALAVSCLIGAAGLQLYWDRQSYQTMAGASGGTYAEAMLGPVDTLNPLFADTPAETAVGELVFSQLLRYDSTGHLNYDLVRDMNVSKDGLAYTISLRTDATWHDGEALTADDVIFTVNLMKDAATRTKIRGWSDISAEKTDDHTVVFRLTSAYAPFESALTFPVVPKHILGNVAHESIREHDFGNNPIGSGPFAFRLLQDTGVAEKQIIHLAANGQYYGQQSKLSRFQVLVAPDQDAILAALNLNEVNGASEVSRELLHKLPKDRYDVLTQPVQAGVYALFNNDSDILSDRSVRRALRAATNTRELRDKVGYSVPDLSLPYTHIDTRESKLSIPSYNPDEAARLLDKAGWKLSGDTRKKKGQELRLSVVTTKNADYERALEVIIGQWRKVGVAVDERVVDAADPTQSFVQSILQPRTYDVLLYQLVIGGDPDVFAYWHSSQAVARGLNLSNYSNALSDDILSSARAAESQELREAKHVAFARQWLVDAPAIGLYQSVTHTVVSKNVRGMNPNMTLVTPSQRYSDAPNWTVGEHPVYRTP